MAAARPSSSFLDSVSPEAAVSYLSARGRARGGADFAIAQLKKEPRI